MKIASLDNQFASRPPSFRHFGRALIQKPLEPDINWHAKGILMPILTIAKHSQIM
jgi:hypothetical protein